MEKRHTTQTVIVREPKKSHQYLTLKTSEQGILLRIKRDML